MLFQPVLYSSLPCEFSQTQRARWMLIQCKALRHSLSIDEQPVLLQFVLCTSGLLCKFLWEHCTCWLPLQCRVLRCSLSYGKQKRHSSMAEAIVLQSALAKCSTKSCVLLSALRWPRRGSCLLASSWSRQPLARTNGIKRWGHAFLGKFEFLIQWATQAQFQL